MRPLCSDDEFPHSPVGSSAAPWLDTWWFVCRDDEHDVLIELHLTLMAAPAAGARAAVLVRHGAHEVTETHVGLPHVGENYHGTEHVTVTVEDPEWTSAKRVRIRGRARDAEFDLRLTGRYDAADAALLAPGFLPTDASSGGQMRNAQQGMTFAGDAVINGSRLELRGSAFRDRSWGWRENNELLKEGWLAVLGHTSDSVYSAVGFFAGPSRRGEGGRMSGWIATADGVHVATGVDLCLDAAGIPSGLNMSTTGGAAVRVARATHIGATYLPFHDAPTGANELVIAMMNHHVLMTDSAGHVAWGYANLGTPMWTRPFDGMTPFPRHAVGG